MRTLAQQRSAFALRELGKLPGSKDFLEKFNKEVTAFPSLVLQNGFGQALAFYLSKGEEPKTEIVRLVREWLASRPWSKIKAQENRTFLVTLSDMEVADYLAAQRETLAFLEWVKRYANAGLFGS